MFISDYERKGIEIKSLPLSKLRAIDIRTVEEEELVQKLVDEKLLRGVPRIVPNIDDIKRRLDKDMITRNLTKEKELEYQKEVDERVAKANNRTVDEKFVETTPVVDSTQVVPENKIKKLKNK
jgi:hypothetical protein